MVISATREKRDFLSNYAGDVFKCILSVLSNMKFDYPKTETTITGR
jgi:hypothetical protein